jgi:flavin-dependent dehydrogenase
VGYHFDTSMSDGFWLILDDNLAPQGYAYLLVMRGRGTVKTCMYAGFKQEKLYVERTVERFRRLVGLEMRNERFHGGVGNFHAPASAQQGRHFVVGEQAGFQDAFASFGMRYAILSGVMAARASLTDTDFDPVWHRDLEPAIQTSVVNRAVFSALGNRGYRWLLRSQAWTGDTRGLLRWLYRPARVRRLLLPWARRRYQSLRRDESCNHVDCDCVWCRCGGSA